jgi:hypothetical protein
MEDSVYCWWPEQATQLISFARATMMRAKETLSCNVETGRHALLVSSPVA